MNRGSHLCNFVTSAWEMALLICTGKSITIDRLQRYLHEILELVLVDVHVVYLWVKNSHSIKLHKWVHFILSCSEIWQWDWGLPVVPAIGKNPLDTPLYALGDWPKLDIWLTTHCCVSIESDVVGGNILAYGSACLKLVHIAIFFFIAPVCCIWSEAKVSTLITNVLLSLRKWRKYDKYADFTGWDLVGSISTYTVNSYILFHVSSKERGLDKTIFWGNIKILKLV